MKGRGDRHEVIKVLIADDDPIVRHAVRSVLDAAGGFSVVGEAEDGKIAVESSEKKTSEKNKTDRKKAVDTAEERTREIGNDYSRVVRAWTEAGIEYWSGVTRVAGDYFNNVTDTLKDGFDRRRDDEDADSYEAGTGVVADLSHHTAQAYSDAAQKVADSMNRFGEAYDEKEGGAHRASKAKAAAK